MSENPDIDLEAAAFVTAFGGEMRRARQGRGWSREDLLAASGLTVAMSTVAAQELGVHDISAFELSRYCRALGIDSGAILDTAYRSVLGSTTYLYVDLAALAQASAVLARPLPLWAQERIAELPEDANTGVLATDNFLDDMAEQCHVSRADLVHSLVKIGVAWFAPSRAEEPPAIVTPMNPTLEPPGDPEIVARWPFLVAVIELPGPPWQFRLIQGSTLSCSRAHDTYTESLWVISKDVVALNRTPVNQRPGRTASRLDFVGTVDEVAKLLRLPVRWDEP